jgi:PPM family protein phosphatase
MQISIEHITGVGKRQNNEDCILLSPEHGLFIVCDGVGGNNKGEIASSLACDTISNYIINNREINGESSVIQEAVRNTEGAFLEYISTHPESEGMATTLSCLQLYDNAAVIAHIGDSRVYHIRNGKIIFKTEDHSLVNEYIASGFIRPEEAKNHPKKNVITRAIQTNGGHTEAETKQIEDIQASDYFILCSDGLLEGIDDPFIEANFLANSILSEICVQIEELCLENSNDNYSGIFIKVSTLAEENEGKKSWFNIFNF